MSLNSILAFLSEHGSPAKRRRHNDDPTEESSSSDDVDYTTPAPRVTTAGRGRARECRRGRGSTRGTTSASGTDTVRHGRGDSRGRGRGVRRDDSRGRGRGCSRTRGPSLGRRGGRGRGHATGRGHGTIPGNGRAAGIPFLPVEWENVEPTYTKFTYSPIPGPNVWFPDNTRPLDLFLMHFTDQVWNLLVTETNRYATLRYPAQQYARTWFDVTCQE